MTDMMYSEDDFLEV